MSLIVSPQAFTEAAPDPVAQVAKSLHFRLCDYLAVFAYVLAFVLNILTAQTDAELTYGSSRDPQYFGAPLPPLFEARLNRWHIMNALKCGVLLTGWITVSCSLLRCCQQPLGAPFMS
jgi:hypothetical protein